MSRDHNVDVKHANESAVQRRLPLLLLSAATDTQPLP
jgi:hypothetical protein